MKQHPDHIRLNEHYSGKARWLHWGPYLSERQWGTVREDYSANGDAWNYFPHDHARSRAYRWGEDGIAGISDHRQRLCFAIALWNGQDAILKERLFGLTGPQGNHAEDVKELYYYLDSLPSHAYMKHLYKYPHQAFPYDDLLATNGQRGKLEREYELLDTGIFEEGRYFDVYTEYAKGGPEDILIKITVCNRGPAAPIWVLPTLWFRNRWSFGLMEERPQLTRGEIKKKGGSVLAQHPDLPDYHLYFEPTEHLLMTENETNQERLFGMANESLFVKDAFHDAVIKGAWEPYASHPNGTKCAPVYHRELAAGETWEIHLRLTSKKSRPGKALGEAYTKIFAERLQETDSFYARFAGHQDPDLANIQRQAYAGMLWTKQFYHIDIPRWLEGDPGNPKPPASRRQGRNHEWKTLNNEDIISMPDKWEYPWYAAWDLAFHCVPLAQLDAQFAKDQLILFLREWYMHPNGQIPAYEWHFSDVNPPVHAWACLQVFHLDQQQGGKADTMFLERVFQKLLINFTWWVNRKDRNGNNVFEGGFLGLDNIGVFDRSSHIPGGGRLEQADATGWMALYCLNMMEMALILAEDNVAYEDVATKFFEHFVYISQSINQMRADWKASWNEEDGFFYDILSLPNGQYVPLKVRSLVGLTTLFAVFDLDKRLLKKVPGFARRLNWFVNYLSETSDGCLVLEELQDQEDILLSLVPQARLQRMLQSLLDEQEFLAPGGIRSLSKIHADGYHVEIRGQHYGLRYTPAESDTYMFGGNSNWRGPIWLPMNYMLIASLRQLHRHFGEGLTVEYPTGSGQQLTLDRVADEISKRIIGMFQLDEAGRRPIHGTDDLYERDPHFRDLVLFYEYFDGDNSRGVGASHQTGWTGLVATMIEEVYGKG